LLGLLAHTTVIKANLKFVTRLGRRGGWATLQTVRRKVFGSNPVSSKSLPLILFFRGIFSPLYSCVLSVCISITHAYSKCTGNFKAALDTREGGDDCIMGENTDFFDD
jgi:hypothetical protein